MTQSVLQAIELEMEGCLLNIELENILTETVVP
jgi:hypothetical protein